MSLFPTLLLLQPLYFIAASVQQGKGRSSKLLQAGLKGLSSICGGLSEFLKVFPKSAFSNICQQLLYGRKPAVALRYKLYLKLLLFSMGINSSSEEKLRIILASDMTTHFHVRPPSFYTTNVTYRMVVTFGMVETFAPGNKFLPPS